MAVTPSSVVHFCSVPLGKNQKHQILFANSDEQYNYFYSKKVKSLLTGCKYVKGENDVYSVPINKDEIINCNYIMYKNTAYSNKWFYAFVTNIEYSADSVSHITIKNDVYQTWLFDTVLKDSHVERGHLTLADDVIGSIPTTDENLFTGDYVSNTKWSFDSGDLSLIVACSRTPNGVDVPPMRYSGVVTGYQFYAFNNDTVGLTNLASFISALENDDDIGFMFLVLKSALPPYNNGDAIASCSANITNVSKPTEYTSIDGYTPKNNKLYMYPFNFLYMTTNNGVSGIYKYEYFTDPANLNFQVAMNLSVEPRMQVTPRAYKGQILNYDESITLDGFPQCSWRSDFYKSWLSTNGLSQALSIGGGILAVAGGAVTANPIAISAGGLSIAQSIGGFAQASVQPDQVKGGNKGSINVAVDNLNIDCYKKSIDKYHAEIIDDYFEQFGYKINRIQYVPVYTRKYWNYVKTLEVCITGNIPPNDLDELKSIYDNGVTIWHNPLYFMDYTKNNHEVI